MGVPLLGGKTGVAGTMKILAVDGQAQMPVTPNVMGKNTWYFTDKTDGKQQTNSWYVLLVPGRIFS